MSSATTARARITENWNAASVVFLLLSLAGLVSTAAFNVTAVIENRDFFGDWFGSGATVNSLGADLLVIAVAGCMLMLIEARRLGMRFVWAYILLSVVTAIAFTFPLFLCNRERRLVAMRKTDRSVL